MADANVRYAFKVEWFDTVASLNRPYDLYYFPHDKTLEMVTDCAFAMFGVFFLQLFYFIFRSV
jgi:hypothetical protein